MKKGFTACQIKDLFAPSLTLRRNGGRERCRFVGKAHCLPNFNSHTNGRLGFAKCKALSSSFAFTLAEVLITLAVIGVVAALTIPTVIHKIQDQQLKAQFKAAYSDMQRVFGKTVLIDFGGNLNCYYYYSSGYVMSDCVQFFKVFSENFKVIKYCSNNAYENGCLPKYNNVDTSCGGSGFSTGQINYISPVRVLANGSILIPYSNGIYPMFAVDINGKKNPNKWGYDVFAFGMTIDSKKQVILNGGACSSSVEDGGRTLAEMLKFAYQ